jgi:hypothetical protein
VSFHPWSSYRPLLPQPFRSDGGGAGSLWVPARGRLLTAIRDVVRDRIDVSPGCGEEIVQKPTATLTVLAAAFHQIMENCVSTEELTKYTIPEGIVATCLSCCPIRAAMFASTGVME